MKIFILIGILVFASLTEQSINRKERPRMRSTSEFAKTMHNLFESHDKDGISKRAATNTIVGNTANSTFCPYVSITCNTTYNYRSYDGSCNNLANPLYGSSNIPYQRFLAPMYADNYSTPRTISKTGSALPNVRTLSLRISPPISGQKLSATYTHLLPIFGQFLTHDIAGFSTTTDKNGDELSCPCGSTDPSCLPISIPSNDLYLGQSCTNSPSATGCSTPSVSTQTCMNFTRSSATFPDFSCTASYREQLNLLSSYIDGTAIYGLDSVRANALRSFSRGLLKTSSGIPAVSSMGITNRTYLPLANDTCSYSSNPFYNCFLGGEHRTSENLGLNSMQVLFNREHNRIAAQLAVLNPSWSDEAIYQTTRKIVIAQLQHITYNEFLPLITGSTVLSPLASGTYYTGYNSKLNPSLYNEFGTAAFRMGHSMIRQTLSRYYPNNTAINQGTYSFQSVVFQSDYAYSPAYAFQGINSILVGLTSDLAWKLGTFGNQLQNNLFQNNYLNGSTYSFDLLAININRGRDHGLPGYVYYINSFFNLSVNSWTSLTSASYNGTRLLPPVVVSQLQGLYGSVYDIDLFVAGLLENPVNQNGPTVGPTFAYMITQQFSLLKAGDRFYYENGPSSTAFTLNQLSAIKNVTISGLICNNYDITLIQPKGFLANTVTGNSLVSCSTLMNQINLNNWLNQL